MVHRHPAAESLSVTPGHLITLGRLLIAEGAALGALGRLETTRPLAVAVSASGCGDEVPSCCCCAAAGHAPTALFVLSEPEPKALCVC